MNQFIHIIKFEWKSLWRSSMVRALIVVTLGAGIYGIFFGKFEIDKQRTRIAQVQSHEKSHFDSLLIWAKLDTAISTNNKKFQRAVSPTGVGWNKHFTYYMTHEPSAIAGLCLGQRDLYSVYYGFDVTALHKQIYVGELANPMKLLTGNFDLSYVFVFIFPLLIISLFYSLYAAEKEGGTLPLLRAQPIELFSTLASKGALRFALVLLLATILLLLAFLFQGVSITANFGSFLQWLFIIYSYCLFWLVIMTGIICLKTSAALSAMLGLGAWLIFTLVTPAILNLTVSAGKPLPKRAETIHAIRTLNDKNWESPKSFVFSQFYKENPNYNQGDTTDFNKWYYASFTILDAKARELNDQFEKQVIERNRIISQWQWLAPGAMVHEKLAAISKTDRSSHLEFLQKVEAYHQELKDIYYPQIFSGKLFTVNDLKVLEKML